MIYFNSCYASKVKTLFYFRRKKLIHMSIKCRITTNIIDCKHFISNFFQYLIYWTLEILCPRYKDRFLYFISHSIMRIKNKRNHALYNNKVRSFYLFVTFAFYERTNIMTLIVNFNIINVDWKQNIKNLIATRFGHCVIKNARKHIQSYIKYCKFWFFKNFFS